MKLLSKIILSIVLSLLTLSGYADTTFRDKYGKKVGSSSTNGNETIYRDKYGNKTGSSSSGFGKQIIFRDKYGNKTGSSSFWVYIITFVK